MKNGLSELPHQGSSLNTLVRNVTRKTVTSANKGEIVVRGNGALVTDRDVAMRKAKNKMIGRAISLSMVDFAKANGEKKLSQSLWNTYHCQNKLRLENGKVFGNYCKNRWCPTCNGNRSAELIRKYLPIISTWEEPYFVTLTAKSVSASRLNWMVRCMLRAIRLIVDKHRKRQRRGKGKQLTGLRTMESNFNVQKRTYNVHFHIIVPNEETAIILRNDWIALWNRKNIKDKGYVYPKAQDIRKVNDKVKGLIEIFKYSTKIFTPEDVKKKKLGRGTPHKIYAKALYNIIRAFKGHQLFDSFGDCRVGSANQRVRKETILTNSEELEFDPKQNDWVNIHSNEPLASYTPDASLSLLMDNIDRETE